MGAGSCCSFSGTQRSGGKGAIRATEALGSAPPPDELVRQQIGADPQRGEDVAADLEQQLRVPGVVLGRRIPPVIRPEFQQHCEKEGRGTALPARREQPLPVSFQSSSLKPSPRRGFGNAHAAAVARFSPDASAGAATGARSRWQGWAASDRGPSRAAGHSRTAEKAVSRPPRYLQLPAGTAKPAEKPQSRRRRLSQRSFSPEEATGGSGEAEFPDAGGAKRQERSRRPYLGGGNNPGRCVSAPASPSPRSSRRPGLPSAGRKPRAARGEAAAVDGGHGERSPPWSHAACSPHPRKRKTPSPPLHHEGNNSLRLSSASRVSPPRPRLAQREDPGAAAGPSTRARPGKQPAFLFFPTWKRKKTGGERDRPHPHARTSVFRHETLGIAPPRRFTRRQDARLGHSPN